MQNIFYSSKDEIRNRILKNARDFWGVKNAADFDPFVKLVLEALSSELFLISSDLRNLENRILDKISRILASDTLISAIPAHGILHADPIEAFEQIDSRTQFYYKKKIRSKADDPRENTVDLFFSSLESVRLYKAEVAYLASGKNLHQFDKDLSKQLRSNQIFSQEIAPGVAYLALDPQDALKTIAGMSFYFDWRNLKVSEETYDLLKLSSWSINGLPLEMVQQQFTENPQPKHAATFDRHDMLQVLTQDIHAYYSSRFLTISNFSSNLKELLQLYPQEMESSLSQAGKAMFQKPMIWFKIQFPAAITAHMLDELHISINAFPVVNKKLNDVKHRLKMMSHIIPLKLKEHEQFLSIHELSDQQGNTYEEIPQGQPEEVRHTGTYSVRYGGTERFDNRHAKEMVDYLFELLRDEKAAFTAYGSDFLNSSLREIEQNISVIEEKTKAQLSSLKELLNYVVVKPKTTADLMFLEFWTTQAELGNNLSQGNLLQAFDSSKLVPESIQLLSSTQGGRSRLNSSNRVQAYKYGLTTADRIVTKADIINFCKYELGSKITEVRIAKGLIAAHNPKEGFLKTTDILLRPSAAAGLRPQEWEAILDLTKSKLENRSTMQVHYRLLLDHK